MAWFVTYVSEMKVRPQDGPQPEIESNVILLQTHPLIWAANLPVHYREYYVTKVRFFVEISEGLITDKVREWCSVEN